MRTSTNSICTTFLGNALVVQTEGLLYQSMRNVSPFWMDLKVILQITAHFQKSFVPLQSSKVDLLHKSKKECRNLIGLQSKRRTMYHLYLKINSPISEWSYEVRVERVKCI